MSSDDLALRGHPADCCARGAAAEKLLMVAHHLLRHPIAWAMRRPLVASDSVSATTWTSRATDLQGDALKRLGGTC